MNVNLVKQIDGHVLLKVTGDILMENSKDFYSGVHEILNHFDTCKNLSFDFSKVQFMDSSGIGSLIKLTSEVRKKSCLVSIFNLNKNLSAVFQLSGISSIIKVRNSNDFYNEFPVFEKENNN